MNYQEAIERQNYLIQRESSKSGLRGKVNAKCIECTYDPLSGMGSWRQQITDCTSPNCPLYPVRPLSSKEDPQEVS